MEASSQMPAGSNAGQEKITTSGSADRTKSSAAPLPVLILGIGNLLLRDEGVGIHVIQALQRLRDLPDHVELVDGGTAGADLVDLLADRHRVIVIDAMDAEGTPGSIYRVSGDELLPEPGAQVSLHQVGLVESLLMAKQLTCAPRDVVVYGVQPEQIRPGLDLTGSVAAAVPRVVQAVRDEIARCG